HNTVICDNVLADGIVLVSSSGTVVTKNHVVMNDSFFGGITLTEGTNNTYVGQNRVEGSGAFALDIFGFTRTNRSNTLVGNNIASFQSTFVDVFLDGTTRDKVLVGKSG